MANVCSTIFCARESASARFDSREPRMKGIWRTVLALALSGAVAMPALASALEECVAAGDAAAVLRCLTEEDTKANVELSNAEAAAAKRARELEQATGRAGAHAALAKTVRDFAAYRASQCGY